MEASPTPCCTRPGSCRILSDSGSASERRMASCADVLVISTITFWQLYPFK